MEIDLVRVRVQVQVQVVGKEEQPPLNEVFAIIKGEEREQL